MTRRDALASTAGSLVALASLGWSIDAFAQDPSCPNSATTCEVAATDVCWMDDETDPEHPVFVCDASVTDGDYGASVTIVWDDHAACDFGGAGVQPGYCAWGTTTIGEPFCCVLAESNIPAGMERIDVYVGDIDNMQDSILFQATVATRAYDLDAYTGGTIVAYAYGRRGTDQVWGSRVNSADYAEELDGGIGDDILYGFDGEDVLYGQAGEDLLDGGPHDDWLDGGTNDDVLSGGGHEDTILGGYGRDFIAGNGGDDDIDGGYGDDDICGDDGVDTIVGGADDDQIQWNAPGTGESIDGGYGADVCQSYAYPYVNPANCEGATGGSRLVNCP